MTIRNGHLAAALALALSATSLRAGGDIVGTWMSEPILGQLGYIQTTYVFRKNGSFSAKSNFLSFCGIGAVKPDCEYFWIVDEGDYLLVSDSVTLTLKTQRSVQQRQGQAKPIVRAEPLQRVVSSTYTYQASTKSITLTEKDNGRQHVFSKQ